MKAITSKMLREAGACEDQYDLFVKTFGAAAEVTESNCLRAAAAGLCFYWAADKLLSVPAQAEYERLMAPAQAEYERLMASAWAERERVRVLAFCRAFNRGNVRSS